MISDVSVEKNEDDDESSVMSNKFRVLSLRQSLKVIRLAVRFPAGWSVSNSLLSYGLYLISTIVVSVFISINVLSPLTPD